MAKMVDRIRKALGIPVRIQGAEYTDEWWGDVPPATSAVLYGVELASAGTDAVRTPTHGVPALFADVEEDEEDDTDWEAKLRDAKARAAAPAIPKAVIDSRPPAPVVAAAVKAVAPAVVKPVVAAVVKPIVAAPAPIAKAPTPVAPKASLPPSVRQSPFAKKLDFVEAPKKPEIAPIKKPKDREPTLQGIPTARIPKTPDWLEDKDDWSKVIERAKEKTARAALPPKPKREEEDWDALIRRAKQSAVG
jgi:hypothetical protein